MNDEQDEELQEDEQEEQQEEERDYLEDSVIKVILPKPHFGQKLVLDSTAKWRVLMCGRRWGKSFICLILSLQTMLKGGAVAYITPTYSLGREFFNEILKFIPQKLIKFQNKAEFTVRIITGGEIKFFSGEVIRRDVRGRSFNRIIIDEAGYISTLEEDWNSALMPCLATTDGDCLFVSTPNGRNFFHSLYQKGLDGVDGYESFHFPSSASPFVSQEFLETARATVSQDTFNQEYLAIPLASIGNPFGELHIRASTIEELSTNSTVVYGIDVAKYRDWTVIIGLDFDGAMTHFDRFRGEWSLTELRVKELPDNIVKIIDSTGVGDVVFERLLTETDNIHGFKFNLKTKPSIMRELIVDIQQGKLKFTKPVAEEMQSFEYSMTAAGHPLYQAQSGYHDDCIMSLAMANHYQKIALSNIGWKLYYA